MYNALYIEDEKTPFVVYLLRELERQGILCDFQYWSKAANSARIDSRIDFRELIRNLGLEASDIATNYDLLILDIMMPPEGMRGTCNGHLTGIVLHKKMLEASPSIKELKTFFITNLTADNDPLSYYTTANNYSKEVNAILFSKDNAKVIAETIAEEIRATKS